MHTCIVKYSRPFLTTQQISALSHKNGLEGPLGMSLRIQGFHLAMAVCRSLKFPIKTFDVSMIEYLHTLIYAQNVSNFNMLALVGACIILGFKSQDTPKKTREVAAAILNQQKMPADSKEVEELRLGILAIEQQVMETICFDFRFSNPHLYVIKLGHELELDKAVARTAWDVTTDMFFTYAPLRQPSHTLALAAIILAAKLHNAAHVFPINSSALLSERPGVNECLEDLLNFYMLYHKETVLAKSSTPGSIEEFEQILTPISRELGKLKQVDVDCGDLFAYDPKTNDNTTAEYLLYKP